MNVMTETASQETAVMQTAQSRSQVGLAEEETSLGEISAMRSVEMAEPFTVKELTVTMAITIMEMGAVQSAR